jgi:hypothetical protein
MSEKKPLTSKQEAFCRAFVSGGENGEGMSLSDAYRQSYDVDPATKSNTVNSLSSRLYQKVQIRGMIESLLAAKRRGAVASALSRRDKAIRYYEQVMDGAIETDQLSLRAAELLGRASGLFSTDISVTDKREKSGTELAAEIEALLLTSQEVDESASDDDVPESGPVH